jgi:hypothetical protein
MISSVVRRELLGGAKEAFSVPKGQLLPKYRL